MNIDNDERIFKLKKQIEGKKEQLNKIVKFTPVTNCVIELDEVRTNINVLKKDQLLLLMVKLNTYRISALDLQVVDELMVSGYTVTEWIEDIQNRIAVLTKKDEENRLKEMEDKLVLLLSDGKKVELELDKIENLLN